MFRIVTIAVAASVSTQAANACDVYEGAPGHFAGTGATIVTDTGSVLAHRRGFAWGENGGPDGDPWPGSPFFGYGSSSGSTFSTSSTVYELGNDYTHYAGFVIFDVSGMAPVSSAKLTFSSVSTCPGGDWTDVKFVTKALELAVEDGPWNARDVYMNVVHIGKRYASTPILGGETDIMIELNATGIAALNAAIAGDGRFRLGGTLVPAWGTVPLPEPGTWTMLIAGFGMVGSAVRRRRAAIA